MPDSNSFVYGGFSYSQTAAGSYVNTDFGFYIQGSNLNVYEHGNIVLTQQAVTSAFDIFKIEYDGTHVNYYYNNDFIYTSLNSVTNSLYILFSIYAGNKVTDVCVVTPPGPTQTSTPTLTLTKTPTRTATPTKTATRTIVSTPTATGCWACRGDSGADAACSYWCDSAHGFPGNSNGLDGIATDPTCPNASVLCPCTGGDQFLISNVPYDYPGGPNGSGITIPYCCCISN